jgi:ribosomal protein L21
MSLTVTKRGLSLAIAAALVLLVTTLAHCQAKQYRVVRICIGEKCEDVKIGTIAVTSSTVYITIDGIKTSHKIVHYFKYKHEDHYRIEGGEFKGWLIISSTSAKIELYGIWVGYIFNKTKFE